MEHTIQRSRIKPRSLRVGYFNANGLLKQREEIATFLRDHQIDVFLIQETFLKPGSRSPRIANYEVVRDDRTTSALGGTLIYFKRSLHCIPVEAPRLTFIEASVCRIGMTGHPSIYLVSAYLSPGNQKSLLDTDIEALANIGDSVLVAGDLNAKNVMWNCHSNSPRGRKLEQFAERYNFDILAPGEPTHYPEVVTYRPDILDIVLLKNVNLLVDSLEVFHELDSDHRPVILDLTPPDGRAPHSPIVETKVVVDWKKLEGDLQAASSPHLDAIPDQISSPEDTLLAIDSLTKHVQSVVNESSRRVPAMPDHRWSLPDDVRALMTEKNRATRAYDSYPTDENRSHLRALQREVKYRINDMRNSRWDRKLEEIEPTHQAFWQLTRSLKAHKADPMPPLTRPNGLTPAFEDDEKAECLADSLESQCSPSSLPCDQAHLSLVEAEVASRSLLPPSGEPLPPVTPEEVEFTIKDLHPKKSPGSDGITNKVVKHFPAPLIALLAAIFSAAMSNASFPQSWKEAIVIGIRKPGKPASEPSSYRPISLLNTLGKLYERIIYSRLKDVIASKSLIPIEQFGFRARHSCVQQVHRIVEHIVERFPQNIRTGALFFDVAKAFDKVWHDGLVYKLYTLGVPDRLVLIIRDFLTNRTFRYRLEGVLSSPRPIRAGVPQGSVLSPILFSLYTSDIPKQPMTQVALFADDTAVFTSHRSPNYTHRILQSYANALGDWFRKWRIEVNPEKSAAVYFSPGLTRKLPKPVELFGKPIPWVKEVKYLGVILDRRLSFASHIKRVRNRAAFVLNRLHPLINKKSKLSLRNKVRIYKTCIRPIMTYAGVTFAHVAPRHIHRLQTLQNKFLRKATGAPWYLRNEDLHIDLELPTIVQYLKSLSRKYFDSAPHHPNELVRAAADYDSYISSAEAIRRHHVLRRPKHVLKDPDDDITLAIEAHNQLVQPNTAHRHRPRRRGRGPSD